MFTTLARSREGLGSARRGRFKACAALNSKQDAEREGDEHVAEPVADGVQGRREARRAPFEEPQIFEGSTNSHSLREGVPGPK